MADPYMTKILTGGLMGTFMWANVWFVIWPAQQVVIANAENVAGGGEPNPEAAARAGRAGMASRTNTVLSIPMLFFMGSASHLPSFLTGTNDLVYCLVAGAIILFVEAQALIGPGTATQKTADYGLRNYPRRASPHCASLRVGRPDQLRSTPGANTRTARNHKRDGGPRVIIPLFVWLTPGRASSASGRQDRRPKRRFRPSSRGAPS